MGRKKIQISRITDERNRQVTFNKRKFGVMKKAYELSVLCDCEIALIIFSSSNKLYQYASTDMDKVLLKYTEYNEPHESLTNKNIIEALNKKEHKNGLQSPDSPDVDHDFNITPRTEAKYQKIDEDFSNMMRQNQNQVNGNRSQLSLNYNSMPVSVPVNNHSYDTGLMQPSPQMSQSLSPRPASSADNLNGSNGYPSSPIPPGGAPSPSILARPQPSKTHSPTRPNLRVLISNSQAASLQRGSSPPLGMNTPQVNVQSNCSSGGNSNSNVGLNYSNLNSYNNADFLTDIPLGSVNSLQWSQSSLSSSVMSHPNLPHLSVSSSTPPPPSSSPVRVKAEPPSPPRDQLHHLHRSSPSRDHLHLPRPSSAEPHNMHSPGHHLFSNISHLEVGHLQSQHSPDGSHPSEYDPPHSKRLRLTEGWTT